MSWQRLRRFIRGFVAAALILVAIAACLFPAFFEDRDLLGFKDSVLINNAEAVLILSAIIFIKMFVIDPVAQMIVRRNLHGVVSGWAAAGFALLGIALWLYGIFSDDVDFIKGGEVSLLAAAGMLVILLVVRPVVAKAFSYLPAARQQQKPRPQQAKESEKSDD